MRAEIRYGGTGFSLLVFHLSRGEEVFFEAGAYVYHRGPISFTTTTGGLGAALKRKLLGGETFFLNKAVAEGDAQLALAPALPGDIVEVPIEGGLVVQDTSYLAHTGEVRVSARWKGLRGLLAEGEAFWTHLSGRGRAWLSSYGAIEEYSLAPGESIIVDNGHIVAVEDSVGMRIRKFGGLKSFLFGGEGIVVELVGPGRVLLQTRNLSLLARLLAPRK